MAESTQQITPGMTSALKSEGVFLQADRYNKLQDELTDFKPTKIYGAEINVSGLLNAKDMRKGTRCRVGERKNETNLVDHLKQDKQINAMLKEALRMGVISQKDLEDRGIDFKKLTTGEKVALETYPMSHVQKAEAIALILGKFQGENLPKTQREDYYRRVLNEVVLKDVQHIDNEGGPLSSFGPRIVINALVVAGNEENADFLYEDSYRPSDRWNETDKSRRQVAQTVSTNPTPNFTQILEGKTNVVEKKRGHLNIEHSADVDLRVAQAMNNLLLPPRFHIELAQMALDMQKESDPTKKEELRKKIVDKRREGYAALENAYDVQNYQIGGKYLQEIRERTAQERVLETAKQINASGGTKDRFENMNIFDANQEALIQTASTLLNFEPDRVRLALSKMQIDHNHLEQLKNQFKNESYSGKSVNDQANEALFQEFYKNMNVSPQKNISTDQQKMLRMIFMDRVLTKLALQDRFRKVEDPSQLTLKTMTESGFGLKGVDLLFRRTLPSGKETEETYDDYVHRLRERLRELSKEKELTSGQGVILQQGEKKEEEKPPRSPKSPESKSTKKPLSQMTAEELTSVKVDDYTSGELQAELQRRAADESSTDQDLLNLRHALSTQRGAEKAKQELQAQIKVGETKKTKTSRELTAEQKTKVKTILKTTADGMRKTEEDKKKSDAEIIIRTYRKNPTEHVDRIINDTKRRAEFERSYLNGKTLDLKLPKEQLIAQIIEVESASIALTTAFSYAETQDKSLRARTDAARKIDGELRKIRNEFARDPKNRPVIDAITKELQTAYAKLEKEGRTQKVKVPSPAPVKTGQEKDAGITPPPGESLQELMTKTLFADNTKDFLAVVQPKVDKLFKDPIQNNAEELATVAELLSQDATLLPDPKQQEALEQAKNNVLDRLYRASIENEDTALRMLQYIDQNEGLRQALIKIMTSKEVPVDPNRAGYLSPTNENRETTMKVFNPELNSDNEVYKSPKRKAGLANNLKNHPDLIQAFTTVLNETPQINNNNQLGIVVIVANLAKDKSTQATIAEVLKANPDFVKALAAYKTKDVGTGSAGWHDVVNQIETDLAAFGFKFVENTSTETPASIAGQFEHVLAEKVPQVQSSKVFQRIDRNISDIRNQLEADIRAVLQDPSFTLTPENVQKRINAGLPNGANYIVRSQTVFAWESFKNQIPNTLKLILWHCRLAESAQQFDQTLKLSPTVMKEIQETKLKEGLVAIGYEKNGMEAVNELYKNIAIVLDVARDIKEIPQDVAAELDEFITDQKLPVSPRFSNVKIIKSDEIPAQKPDITDVLTEADQTFIVKNKYDTATAEKLMTAVFSDNAAALLNDQKNKEGFVVLLRNIISSGSFAPGVKLNFINAFYKTVKPLDRSVLVSIFSVPDGQHVLDGIKQLINSTDPNFFRKLRGLRFQEEYANLNEVLNELSKKKT